MTAESAQARLVPTLEYAHHAVFQSLHRAPDPGCSSCVAVAEGAALMVFREWERFVFDLMADLMAGARTSAHHAHFCVPRTRHGSHAVARSELLRSRYQNGAVQLNSAPRDYLLLHGVAVCVAVSRYWLENSPIESVLSNHAADVTQMMAIRHGLAHGSDHSKVQLRAVMLSLRPFDSYQRPGEFLLSPPQAGGTTVLEDVLDLIYRLGTSMSP